MKKWIFLLFIIRLLGWAVFDFVSSNKQATNEMEDSVEAENDKVDEDNLEGKDVPVGLEVGNRAPEFELQTLNGENVKLSDFRGKRVMINFWASWCGPCREEMPDLQKFYEDKDIEILAVNLTDSEISLDNVKDFRDEFGLTFPILLDTDLVVASIYQIQPIPTTYMVDSNGIITNMAFGALTYDLMVEEFERME